MNIIPEKKRVVVGEKEYFVKKFSIIQGMRFIKWLIKAVMLNQSKLQGMKDKFESSESNSNDILLLLDVVDNSMIIELMSICLDTEEVEYLSEHLSLEKGLEIINEVMELNDIGSLLKNLSRTVKTTTETIGKISKEQNTTKI